MTIPERPHSKNSTFKMNIPLRFPSYQDEFDREREYIHALIPYFICIRMLFCGTIAYFAVGQLRDQENVRDIIPELAVLILSYICDKLYFFVVDFDEYLFT